MANVNPQDIVGALQQMTGGSQAGMGMLGMTPEMFQYGQQQADQAKALQYAQLGPYQGLGYMGSQAGSDLQHMVENMSGYMNPVQKQANVVNNLWQAAGQMVNNSQDSSGNPITNTATGLRLQASTFAQLAQKAGLPASITNGIIQNFMQTAKSVTDAQNSAAEGSGIKPINPGQYTAESLKAYQQSIQKSPNGIGDASLLVNDPKQIGSAPERMNDFVSNVQYRLAHGLPVSDQDKQTAHNYQIYLTKLVASNGQGQYQQGPETLAPGGVPPTITQQTSPESPEPSHPGIGLTYTPGTHPSEYLNAQVDNLSKAYAPLSKFNSSLSTVEQLLQKYRDNPNGIPGFGRIDSMKPIQMLSGDALKMRQAVQTLHNLQILDQGGHTITDNELDRALTQLGSGKFVDPQALINGVVNTRQNYNQYRSSVLHGFDNNTIAEFRRRGGFGSPAGSASQTSSFSKPPAKMSNAELLHALGIK